MAWKRQSTTESVTVDADVDLEEFSTAQLLQELIDRDIISETQAEGLLGKQPVSMTVQGLDFKELAAARDEIISGRRGEALIHLERFLGREWSGRLAWIS